MAATYRNLIIGNKDYEVIVVDESGTSQRLIFKHLLSTFDQKNMDLVEDTGTGSTFFQKMQSTILKNGQTAAETYQRQIFDTTQFSQELGKIQHTPTHIPIIGNSGTFETTLFPSDAERHYISVRFYDASDNMIPVANITSGSVTIAASETEDVQYETVVDGVITFDGTAGYKRPIVAGSYHNLRIQLQSLVSATPIAYAVVLINSYQ